MELSSLFKEARNERLKILNKFLRKWAWQEIWRSFYYQAEKRCSEADLASSHDKGQDPAINQDWHLEMIKSISVGQFPLGRETIEVIQETVSGLNRTIEQDLRYLIMYWICICLILKEMSRNFLRFFLRTLE